MIRLNLSELVKKARYLVDEYTIETDLIIGLFNDALDDLSEVARKRKSIQFTLVPPEKTFSLPEDFIDINHLSLVDEVRERQTRLSMADSLDGDIDHDTFYIDDEKIVANQETHRERTYILDYYAHLPHLKLSLEDTSLDQVPVLPIQYHRILPVYAAFKYFQNWEANPEQRNHYMQEYFAIKEDLMRFRLKQEYKMNKSRKVMITREWV